MVNGVSESLGCNAMLLNIPPTDGFVQAGVYTLLQQYLFFAYIICRVFFQKTENCPLSFFRKFQFSKDGTKVEIKGRRRDMTKFQQKDTVFVVVFIVHQLHP